MWFETLLVIILFKFKNVPTFPQFELYKTDLQKKTIYTVLVQYIMLNIKVHTI